MMMDDDGRAPCRTARVKCACCSPGLFNQFSKHSPGSGPRSPLALGSAAELRPGVPYTSARGSPASCLGPAAELRGGSCPLGRARRHCPGVQALRRRHYRPGTTAVTPNVAVICSPRLAPGS